MKNIKYFVLFILISLIISCSPDSTETLKADELKVISNIDYIQTNNQSKVRSLEDRVGEPIVGVLLKYHKEGEWRKDGYKIVPTDPTAFYLECTYGIYKNGDGMEYNYVLFVPDCIPIEYGVVEEKENPFRSGSAFWWYMDNYINLNMSTIKGDWEQALSILLDSENLPYPNRFDFIYKDDNLNLFERCEDGMNYVLSARQLDPVAMSKAKLKGYDIDSSKQNDFILIKKQSSKEEWTHYLFYPEEIAEVYQKKEPSWNYNSGDPFWWYIKEVYDLDIENTSTEILKAISSGEYIKPTTIKK